MKRYVTLESFVDAVQWSVQATPPPQVFNTWINLNDQRMWGYVATPRGETVIAYTDWIVLQNGALLVMTDDDFKQTYRELSTV